MLYFYRRKAHTSETRGRHSLKCIVKHKKNVRKIESQHLKKKLRFIALMSLIINVPRERTLWMHPRTDAWFLLADEFYTDVQWYENFRVSKETFNFVVSAIEDEVKRKTTILRQPISVQKRVAITFYYLSSTAEYRTIANLFGVSRSFVCMCVRDVCKAIVKKMQSKFIYLPKQHELEDIVETYKRRWGFPGCFGAIDGTHVPILAPTENHADYVNRKGYHSVVMQAVVDSKYLFRDIVIGWPGSVHDARVLSNSKIFNIGEQNKLLPADFCVKIGGKQIAPVILGDPAYPLLPWLLKPYPENANTIQQHRRFNYRLSRARVTVENVFGRWKGRFPRFLKRVDMEMSSLVTVIAASCVLHNICEMNDEEVLSHWLEESSQATATYPQPDPLENVNDREDSVSIRDHFANYFMSAEGHDIGAGL